MVKPIAAKQLVRVKDSLNLISTKSNSKSSDDEYSQKVVGMVLPQAISNIGGSASALYNVLRRYRGTYGRPQADSRIDHVNRFLETVPLIEISVLLSFGLIGILLFS